MSNSQIHHSHQWYHFTNVPQYQFSDKYKIFNIFSNFIRIILYYDEAVKLENAKNATSSPWQNYILLQTKNGIQLPVERYTH